MNQNDVILFAIFLQYSFRGRGGVAFVMDFLISWACLRKIVSHLTMFHKPLCLLALLAPAAVHAFITQPTPSFVRTSLKMSSTDSPVALDPAETALVL